MSKMAAVREILSTNPQATPSEIVALLAKQKLKISENVAANYKSVINRRLEHRKRRFGAVSTIAPTASVESIPKSATGLDPAVVDLLKAGKELGWDKVRTIADLMNS
jgi:hypothetical protein